MMAQAIRASLLATATVTTRAGRRASNRGGRKRLESIDEMPMPPTRNVKKRELALRVAKQGSDIAIIPLPMRES